VIVTFDATATSPHVRENATPALTAALAITAIAAATLAGAWFFQLVLDIRPCPLCLEQRYAYYLAIPLGALVALAAAREAPRGVLLAGLALLAAAMAVTANAAVSAGLASVRAGELFAVASNVTLISRSRASYPARMTLSRQARSHWSVLGCGAWVCRWRSGDSSSAPFSRAIGEPEQRSDDPHRRFGSGRKLAG